MTTWSACSATSVSYASCVGAPVYTPISRSSALTRSDTTFFRGETGLLWQDSFIREGVDTSLRTSDYTWGSIGTWEINPPGDFLTETGSQSSQSAYLIPLSVSSRTDGYVQAKLHTSGANGGFPYIYFRGANPFSAGAVAFALSGTKDAGLTWRLDLQYGNVSITSHDAPGSNVLEARYNCRLRGTSANMWRDGTLRLSHSTVTQGYGRIFLSSVRVAAPLFAYYDELQICTESRVSAVLPSGYKLAVSGVTQASSGTASTTSVELEALEMPFAAAYVLDSSNSTLFSYSASSVWGGDTFVYDEAPTSAFTVTVVGRQGVAASVATAYSGSLSTTEYDWGSGWTSAATNVFAALGSIYTVYQRVQDVYGLQATSMLTLVTDSWDSCAATAATYSSCSTTAATWSECSATAASWSSCATVA